MELAPVNWQANTLSELHDSYMSEEDKSSWYLGKLSNLASKHNVDTITELGIFQGHSICAFLRGNPKKVIGYDIDLSHVNQDVLKKFANDKNIELEFYEGDSLQINIQETDLLFLDSRHFYEHVILELQRHAPMTKKYIIVHDVNYPYDKKVMMWRYINDLIKRPKSELVWATYTYKKVRQAVEEFLNDNKDWTLLEDVKENSGMMILKCIK